MKKHAWLPVVVLLAVVEALVDLLHGFARKNAVNRPAELAMVVGLAARGRALMRRADAKKVLRIGIKAPGAVTVLIHRLAVGDALSRQHPRQRFFHVIERRGVGEKAFQRLFGSLEDSTDGGFGFERRTSLGDEHFDGIVR